uniref:Uncharacterized protein n=1 Tax=Tanacetum cinerariifolium TaxID=118510 RepID=A0A6L2M4V0_TANCI|nr:hypothetical protein [Tanacetum cinerariifolium]
MHSLENQVPRQISAKSIRTIELKNQLLGNDLPENLSPKPFLPLPSVAILSAQRCGRIRLIKIRKHQESRGGKRTFSTTMLERTKASTMQLLLR